MMTHDRIPTSVNLSSRIQTLIHSLETAPVVTPKIAAQLLEEATIEAGDLQLWAEFAHPVADSYGRHLVYDGGDFEVMVMSWAPGDYSAIHDHGAAQWGAVQSFGAAEHSVFRLDQMQLSTVSVHPFPMGSVNAVDSDLIHQMGNPSRSPFLSLHVYGSSNHTGSITGDARIFDLYERSILYTDGGVFFGMPVDQVTHQVQGLQGDNPTTLRHHQQMLSRTYQRLASGENTTCLWQAATTLRQQIANLQAASIFESNAIRPSAL